MCRAYSHTKKNNPHYSNLSVAKQLLILEDFKNIRKFKTNPLKEIIFAPQWKLKAEFRSINPS